MSQSYSRRNHFSQYKLCAFAALLLCYMCPQRSQAQQLVESTTELSKHPDVSVLLSDPQVSLRKGLLFYATSPRPEQDLERLNATSTPFTITVPLEVDRKMDRLYVLTRINNNKVRLMLDTGGGTAVVLNDMSAKDLKLQGKFSTLVQGSQGTEPVIEGLADSLTLGKLTLRAINTFIKHDPSPYYNCLLGLPVFERYCVTLNFDAKTMTLSRGGNPVAVPTDGTTLSLPFRYENGLIFIPVCILRQSTWAMLDSGSDTNLLSFSTAKLAAAQLPPAESIIRILDQKIGTGDTDKGITVLRLSRPVPILMNPIQDTSRRTPLTQADFAFSTVSQFGISTIDAEFNPQSTIPIGVELGLPFFLQFHRVIIDYPNHRLILQGPEHGAEIDTIKSSPKPGKPWPGYQWRPVGDGWVEAPDKKTQFAEAQAALIVSAPTAAVIMQTTGTHITATEPTTETITVSGPTGTKTTITWPSGTKAVVSQPDAHGVVSVLAGSAKTICPPGSTVQINSDGSAFLTSFSGSEPTSR